MEILSDTLFRGNVTIDEDQKLVFQTPSIGNNPTSTISQQSRGNSEVLVICSSGGVVFETSIIDSSFWHMPIFYNGFRTSSTFKLYCNSKDVATFTLPQKSGTIALTSDVGLKYCYKSIDFNVPADCTKFWMSGFGFQASGQVVSAQVFRTNAPIVGPADGLCSNSSVVSMDVTAIDGGHFLLEKSSGFVIPSSTCSPIGSYQLRVVYHS